MTTRADPCRRCAHSGQDPHIRAGQKWTLITSWSLTTGRTLRGGPPQSLTEDELIGFWADDIPAPRTGSG